MGLASRCVLVTLIGLSFVPTVAAALPVGAWQLETGVAHSQRLFVIGSSLVVFGSDLRCYDLATGKRTAKWPLPVDWADFDDETAVVGDVLIGRIGAATRVAVEPCANRIRWARSSLKADEPRAASVAERTFRTAAEQRLVRSHADTWQRTAKLGDRLFAVDKSDMLSAFRIDHGEVVWRSGAGNNSDLVVVPATHDHPALLIAADELGGLQSIPLDAPLPHQRMNVRGKVRVGRHVTFVDRDGKPLTLRLGDQIVSVRRDGSFDAVLDGNGCVPVTPDHTPIRSEGADWDVRIDRHRHARSDSSARACVKIRSQPSLHLDFDLDAQYIDERG